MHADYRGILYIAAIDQLQRIGKHHNCAVLDGIYEDESTASTEIGTFTDADELNGSGLIVCLF